MFETAHRKESFSRRGSTAGRNINLVGANSPVRMWGAGRSQMLTCKSVDSNPPRSVRRALLGRFSAEILTVEEVVSVPPKTSR